MPYHLKNIFISIYILILSVFFVCKTTAQTTATSSQNEIQRVWNLLQSDKSGKDYAIIGDIQITKYGPFYKLNRPSEHGFTLSEITYFQNLAFAHLNKCNCLTPTYDHPKNVYYTQQNEIVNGWGDHVRYEYETKSTTQYTSGLLNTTKEFLYIKAYSKRRAFKYGTKNNPIEYFDESFYLGSNKSMEKADFNTIPIDNGKKINVEELERIGYTQNDEQIRLKGYSEYTRFVGVYTENKKLINECNQKQLSISYVAKSLGPNLYKVDAYTGVTNIKVKSGDKIIIKAKGKIKYAKDKEENGPEGTTDFAFFGPDERYFTEFKLGSLLASIGDCDFYEIGNYDEWVTTCNGVLNIMINDNNPSNNSGSFTVEIKIIRAK